MGTKKDRQNLRDAKTYFNYDITSKNNSKVIEPFDAEMFGVGMRWFSKGRSIDIAPLSLKNNVHFINGFNRAKKLRMIDDILTMEKKLYELGREFAFNGLDLDNVPDEYKNNTSFLTGFNEGLMESLEKKNINTSHIGR